MNIFTLFLVFFTKIIWYCNHNLPSQDIKISQIYEKIVKLRACSIQVQNGCNGKIFNNQGKNVFRNTTPHYQKSFFQSKFADPCKFSYFLSIIDIRKYCPMYHDKSFFPFLCFHYQRNQSSILL